MADRQRTHVILEYAASPAQQRLWFVEQIAPGQPVHNISVEFAPASHLEPQLLGQALRDVIDRHEALRTVFRAEQGELRQIVMSGLEATPIQVRELASAEPDEIERQWQALRTDEARRVFDLSEGPLVRLCLVQFPDAGQRLIIVIHHIVADALSFAILMRDLSTAYEARLSERAPVFGPLRVQYADFTAWQRQRLSTPEAVADLEYWKRQLDGLATIDLTRGRARPADLGHEGSEIEVAVASEAVNSLQREASSHGATLFMAFTALWAEAVGRWFGATDVPLGTPIAGRPLEDVFDVVGLFVDRVVLRIDTSGRPTFRQLLMRTRDVVLAANDHTSVTFDQVVDAIRPPRVLGVTPLFQVGVNLVPLSDISAAQYGNGTARHGLNLDLLTTDSGMVARVEHRHGVVTPTDARGVADLFQRLVALAVADPDQPLRSAPTMADPGLAIRDGGPVDRASAGLAELFFAQATATPDAPAVVTPAAELSYRALAAHAAALAERLARHGVGPDTPVLLAMPRRAELIIGMLGILAAGGAYVPVDPAAPARHAEFVAAAAHARTAVVPAGAAIALPAGVTAVELDLSSPLPHTAAAPVAVDPRTAAYIIFTSGSTGAPKGVVVEHRQVVAYVNAARKLTGSPAGASYLMLQPPTFDSCVTQIYGALCSGGVLHVVDEDLARDPDGIADYCAAHPIDYLKIVPSHLSALLASDRQDLLPQRQAIIGGEGSTSQFIGALVSSGWPVIGHYGPTETTVGVLAHPITAEVLAQRPTTPLGPPMAGVRAYVLDSELDPTPPGGVGELYISGPFVTRGYAGAPGRTALAYLPDPFCGSGARMYRTGDLVRLLPNGCYEFLGRLDRQVKVGGHRIEPGAVEACLQRHPQVRQAAAVVSAQRLIAYVVPTAGAQLDELALRAHVSDEMPSGSVPSAIVVLQALPQKSNGKLDVDALPDPATAVTRDYLAPQTPTEVALCEIIASVLERDRVSVTDGFFDVGGDSIRAIHVVAAARQAGLVITVRDIFAHQTARTLAARVDATAAVRPDDAARRFWTDVLAGAGATRSGAAVSSSRSRLPGDVRADLDGRAHAAYGTDDLDLLVAAVAAEVAAGMSAADRGMPVTLLVATDTGPAPVKVEVGKPASLIRSAKSAVRDSMARAAEWALLTHEPDIVAQGPPDLLVSMTVDASTAASGGMHVRLAGPELDVRAPFPADRVASRLADLVRHCVGAGASYAVEDFPDAGLDGGQLARVLANLGIGATLDEATNDEATNDEATNGEATNGVERGIGVEVSR